MIPFSAVARFQESSYALVQFMNKAPTFSDVASLAGVSTATVSRALNGDPRVLPGTRDSVFRAADELGYIFNDTARSLKTRQSRTIGFVCPELSNNFLMEIAEGIEAELNQLGYHLLLRHSQSDPEVEESAIEELLSRRVDGLILVPADEQRMPEILKKREDIPRLTVDRIWKDQSFPGILTDNRNASREGVLRFQSMMQEESLPEGDWVIMNGPSSITTSAERQRGFEEAMKELEIPGWGQERDSFDTPGGYRSMERILSKRPDSKGALNLFTANYFMHQGATEYLLEQEISPEQVRICAFDYSPLHRLFQYARLFIRQPHLEMGSRAVESLFTLLRKESLEENIILSSSIIDHR